VNAVVVAPGGARPSYAHGYYQRDNAFYTAWDEIARDRARFRGWVEDNIMRGSDAG
jgi:glutaconate CoA-transferase, subunit A